MNSSSEDFALFIKTWAKSDDISLVDAITEFCETESDFDIEDAIDLLDDSLKEYIRVDSIKRNLIRNAALSVELF